MDEVVWLLDVLMYCRIMSEDVSHGENDDVIKLNYTFQSHQKYQKCCHQYLRFTSRILKERNGSIYVEYTATMDLMEMLNPRAYNAFLVNFLKIQLRIAYDCN